MGAFLAYNLKLSFCFVLFYVLYKTALSRNTFYEMNRRVLLFSYLLILLVPVINLPFLHWRVPELQATFSPELYTTMVGFEQFFVQPNPVQIKWTDIVVSIYLVGILFFGVRYLYYTAKIGWILITGEKLENRTGQRVVITNKNIAPFSWMNHIVMSRNDFRENGEEIIAHESAHIRFGHFIDLFLAELFSVIQWYNPAIWLIKNELKDVHEFEADHAVIDSGVNPKIYQLLLIKKAVGSPRFNSLTNSLNHSKLKKRITMMLKEKSSPWAKMKYLTVLPLIAIALTVFARPEISENLEKISEVKISELSSIIEPIIENSSASNIPDIPDILEVPNVPNVPEIKPEIKSPPVTVKKDSLTTQITDSLKQQLAELHVNTNARVDILIQELEKVKKQFDSSVLKLQMNQFEMTDEQKESLKQQMEEMRKYFESDELKQQWKQQMEELRKQFESDEWKQQMEDMKKQFNSEDWKKQMKQFEMTDEQKESLKQQTEEMRKYFESDDWKQQWKQLMEELRKQFESDKLKQQTKELRKQSESDEWKHDQ